MGQSTGIVKKKTAEDYIIDLVVYAIMISFTFICFYPFYYIIVNSVSSNSLSGLGDILFFPRNIHFTNYIQVLKISTLPQAAFVSVSRTVVGMSSTVAVTAFMGFMFTQERMWLRKIWYRMVLITMYFNAGLIPWYLTMRNLGLVNNFFAYIIPALVSPFNMILVKTYIESTPKELQESAEIDGANIITVFFRIILPIITPILATIAIFSAVGQWNSFYDTLILMTEQKLYTLQFVLYIYMNQATLLANQIRSGIGMTESMMNAATRQTEMSVRLTLTIIVIMPILFVYPIFQRFFVQGLMIGAIKG